MIDARAVVADLESFGVARPGDVMDGDPEVWLRGKLQGTDVRFGQDAGGNRTVTLPGEGERMVVLGATVQQASEASTRLAILTGVETLKALTKRFGTQLPCSVQLLLWSAAGETVGGKDTADSSGSAEERPSAYLELQMEPGSHLAEAEMPLGIATTPEGQDDARLSPRLTSLGAEAIEELTGAAVAVPTQLTGGAAAMAKQGVPTAVMLVQAFTKGGQNGLTQTEKLHVLQAAESFGRWAEATVHLLAGDGADLWALEHRVPRS